RVKNFAHRARVNDAAGVIESLQTWEWGTGEPKLGIMIILENVSVVFACEIDKCGPACQAHRHAERKLVRRRDVDDFGCRLLRAPPDHDSFAINWPWNYGRTGETKNAARLVESRIFDPRDFAAVHKRHRRNHHCLLRSSRDDDLIMMTTRASIITQVSRERFA